MELEHIGRIGVLMGGPSSEREISLKSGKAVYESLKGSGLDVVGIDIKTDGLKENIRLIKSRKINCAFLALHGYFGEDGGVQELLESKGIPYTGSGINASKLAMDKLATKKCFVEAGLTTPDYITVTEFQEFTEIQLEINKLGLPVVLKPTRNGSSIGISIIKDIKNLQTGLEKAFEFGYELLIEKYIKGRELTLGILDDKALPIIEIKTAVEFYNYDAKYKDNRTEYLIVKTTSGNDKNTVEDFLNNTGYLSPSLYNEAQELALNAHKVLGCRGFSRVDMLLDNVGKFHLLEVNTIPGFTEKSLLPKAAKAAGMSFSSLCKKIAELAFQNSLVTTDASIQN